MSSVSEQPKRDVAKDRAEFAKRVARGGGMLSAGAFARYCLPHYLTRTAEAEERVATVESQRDHAQRMVEAAIDLIIERVSGPCCSRESIRDYLDQKAKEGAK
jgi:hypothetical protein